MATSSMSKNVSAEPFCKTNLGIETFMYFLPEYPKIGQKRDCQVGLNSGLQKVSPDSHLLPGGGQLRKWAGNIINAKVSF